MVNMSNEEVYEMLDIIESRLRRYNCGEHWLLIKRIEEFKAQVEPNNGGN